MSAPAVYGQTDALAQAVVAWLNGNSNAFCLPVSAERRFALISDLTEIPAVNSPVSIDVFPGADDAERKDGSMAPLFMSSYAIHIYLQQKLSGDPTSDEAQCGVLARLRSEILDSLRSQMFHLTNAVHPVNNVYCVNVKSADRTGLYNLARLLESHVFESDTILVFKASV